MCRGEYPVGIGRALHSLQRAHDQHEGSIHHDQPPQVILEDGRQHVAQQSQLHCAPAHGNRPIQSSDLRICGLLYWCCSLVKIVAAELSLHLTFSSHFSEPERFSAQMHAWASEQ